MNAPLRTFPLTSADSAALFDLDGTLVRTFIDFTAMREAMHELSAFYGTTSATAATDDILEIVARMFGALGAEQGREAVERAYAILEEIEVHGCLHPEPIPGAVALLTELRKRQVKVAIITRNCRRVAQDLTRRMSLAHDLLVAREDTTRFKPHPEPVLFALSHFGVAPARAVMVGDYWADIAAGQAANVGLTIGIQWPSDPPMRFARCPPDVEVSDLGKMWAILLPR